MKNYLNVPCILFCIFILGVLATNSIFAQQSIAVGSGSYASFPPEHEYVGNDPTQPTFKSFAETTAIDVATSMRDQPIPTNDWWTSVLYNENSDGSRHGGNLWTYPLISRSVNTGYQIGHRTAKDWNSDESAGISVDYLISVTGTNFNPEKTIAMNWSDWHVDLQLSEEGSSQKLEVTLAQGMPFVWLKPEGFDAIIEAFHTGVRKYYDANGDILSFPITTDRFVVEYDGNLYGVHLEESTLISPENNNEAYLEISNSNGKHIVISALNDVSDLNFFHQYAFVKPLNTKAEYQYQPENGSIEVSYQIEKEIIKGNEQNLLQGFIPHHYRGNTNNFSFLPNREFFATPRGTLKLAEGDTFNFTYLFNANLLPHFNEPVTNSEDADPYEKVKLMEMVDNYLERLNMDNFADGTYWGGKALVLLLKHTLIAKEIDHPEFETLLSFAKEKTYDWLTYTPGETSFYYAYYPSWKALVGFNEEYYSAFFTDNHFHYGYLAHAGALLEMAEPGAMNGYWDMLTKVIKTYANWDREDNEFPYLRTFSPWMGHSFANGLGNAIGNNQESTSEAMQSWAGMFMTGEITENNAMRDAAAYGYLMESRAIADYWYNESGVFEEIGYNQPIVGILEMNRYVYGTFFGAQETYIHGIQWLPITPAYGFWNDFLTTEEANQIVDPIINNMGNDLERLSGDWMNVCWGFKLFFDPEEVTSQFDTFWNSSINSEEYNVVHGSNESALTYYYAHNSQNHGIRNSDYRISLPLSSAFEKNGKVTYVIYNPKDSAQTCQIFKNGTQIDAFTVPGNTLLTTNGSDNSSSINYVELPAIIEAEDYLIDESGLGYYDTTQGNQGGAYRDDDVDIQVTGDDKGFYNVGWIADGEWLAYPISGSSSQELYTIDLRVASIYDTGSFHLELDGVSITNSIQVPKTNAWQTYTTVSLENIAINPGNHILKFVADQGRFNFNYIDIKANLDESNTVCEGVATNNHYSFRITEDSQQTFLTFIPQSEGIGDSVCILYYSKNPDGLYPGYSINQNTPFQINANKGDDLYFYYTYSLPSGGEATSLSSKHHIVVGSCEPQNRLKDENSIRLYPNPVRDELNLNVIDNIEKVLIYSLNGSLLMKKTIFEPNNQAINIDTKSLNNGMYFIKIYKKDHETLTLPFVKND